MSERNVYCYSNVIETAQAINEEHGYFGSHGRAKKDKEFSDKFREPLTADFKSRNYSFSGPMQDDSTLIFFINEKNGTFGFYTKFAEYFVCPIENFVSMDLKQSGSFKKAEFFMKPTDFEMSIKYRDGGVEKLLLVKMTAIREYLRKSSWLFIFSNDYENLEAMISDRTIKTFEIIFSKITKMKENFNCSNMPNIDIEAKQKEVDEGLKKYQDVLEECKKTFIKNYKK